MIFFIVLTFIGYKDKKNFRIARQIPYLFSSYRGIGRKMEVNKSFRTSPTRHVAKASKKQERHGLKIHYTKIVETRSFRRYSAGRFPTKHALLAF